jgi:hypothetical protein
MYIYYEILLRKEEGTPRGVLKGEIPGKARSEGMGTRQ